jgi:tripartite-type tricarboxylate transporter receptor subunit TctC
MAEAGLSDFDTSIWFGLMAPAGTPQPVVDRLEHAVNEALKSDELVAKLGAQGFDTLGGTSSAFARTIATDIERWTVAARAAGLKK